MEFTAILRKEATALSRGGGGGALHVNNSSEKKGGRLDINICAYTSEATNAVSASVIKQLQCTILCCGMCFSQ